MKLRTRSASCQMSSYCCWVIGMTICLAPRGTCVEGVFRSRSTCRVFGRASILASPSLERSRMTKMPPAGYPAFLQYLQSGRVRNLRDAVCDQFSDRSAGESRAEVCRNAGDEDLLGLSTIIDIVHQEGEQLVRAQRERGRAVLDGASEAQLALLGPAVADPDALTGLVDDDLPLDDSEEAQLEWEQVQAEWIATGFPGCEPAFPVAKDKPRAVDEGFVIIEPDEVKTKAQPSTGRKEVWTFTAVVLVAGLRYAFAEATAEGLWL